MKMTNVMMSSKKYKREKTLSWSKYKIVS